MVVQELLYDVLLLQISSERETFLGLNLSLMASLGERKPLMPSSRGTCEEQEKVSVSE